MKLVMNLPADFSSYLSLLGTVNPSLLQGIFIFFGVFFMALLIGLSRRYIASSSLQGLWAGVVTGIITLLVIEAGVAWGMRSVMTGQKAELLPESIKRILTRSQENLTQVLGIQTEREQPTAQTVISDYQTLTPLDTELVKGFVCKEETKKGE